ncbi:MAG: hypothetical protein JNJ46_12770 [Myxococcales bacterium]|nr:hypothetical protein [Myxococcales bacterium]
MNILALHTMGHDTAACLFRDETLVFAIETERLTRVKHDHQVIHALEHLMAQCALRPEDVDLIALSTNVRGSIARVRDLDAIQSRIEAGALHVEGICELLGQPIPCLVVAHEASHAAVAVHYGGYVSNSVILVNEGRGTFSRNSCFLHREGSLTLVDQDALPWYGTGFGWSALGYLIGFGKSPSAAGTLMAMGAYGRHRPALEALLRGIKDEFHTSERCKQRHQASPLIDYLDAHPSFDDRADLVHTFQLLFSETVHSYLVQQRNTLGVEHIGLGGGCALNLPTNTKIRRELSPSLSIAPMCNDAGQALGAGLYALRFYLGQHPAPFSPYQCGAPLVGDEIQAAIARAQLIPQPYDPEFVAKRLADGAVVAFSQGGSELGPRALGNRSLLASTTRPGMRARVSERIKERQWFRPLAALMREERFAALFPGAPPSPYMLFQYDMPAGLATEATHADGTSRLQTLARDVNPALHTLLAEYEYQTGEPGLINTSLNGPRKAIAYTAQDVIDDFLERDVDLFVFDDVVALRPQARLNS